MKHISTKAIILRRVEFEEADRILTAITPDVGKVSLFAKGVRRAKSKLAGGLELLSVSDIVFIDGKSDLKTIVSARLDRHFSNITKDIHITMQAYECMKCIDEHTESTCDEHFFTLLEHSLESLDTRENDLILIKAWFYTQLLKSAGRSINVEQQVSGKEFEEELSYSFDFENMGFIAQSRGQFTPKHIKFLRLLSKVDSPSNLLKVEDAKYLAGELTPLLEQSQKYL